MPNAPQLGGETLQRDASALFSFVDSICSYCYGDRESPAYLQPSTEFFEYIRKLGDATKAYLNTFPSKAPTDKRLYQDYRQKLESLRYGWFDFHQFIKSALDADTLNVPYSLIEAITKRLNQIQGFEKTSFAIFHFDELNYLEIPIGEIKKTTERLKRVIPDPPVFPENLGLIGIPYSQASSLYLNCLIAHEMGHFAFEKQQFKERLLPEIQKSLEESFGQQLDNVAADHLDWCKDRLASWAEEIFCDLFAVWLIGPCYAFTYIEIFGLTTILNPADDAGFSVTAGSTIFNRSHPADLFRIKQQVSLLNSLGWWGEVDAIRSHYVAVLRSATAVQESLFEVRTTEQLYPMETLKAFLNLAPSVSKLLSEIMKDSNGKALDSGVRGYQKHGKLIGEYLLRAVVPSTVFDGTDHCYPETVSLLNASMTFYLESLEEFMNRLKGQKTLLAGHRSRWVKRLESLTGKALEDHYLLVREKGAIHHDGVFKRADRRSIESADN